MDAVKPPTAKKAVAILEKLLKQAGPASCAYFVSPNIILSLSGARGICDQVFYDEAKTVRNGWLKEITDTVKILQPLADVTSSSIDQGKNPMGNSYTAFNLRFKDGTIYALHQTKLLGSQKSELIKRYSEGKAVELFTEIEEILNNDKSLVKHYGQSLDDIAYGIDLGYPDKAILSTVLMFEERDEPFTEPLISADIRGGQYYRCPIPVYEYPRHLLNDSSIKAHEKLWSDILINFYQSDFFNELSSQSSFQDKVQELGMLR